MATRGGENVLVGGNPLGNSSNAYSRSYGYPSGYSATSSSNNVKSDLGTNAARSEHIQYKRQQTISNNRTTQVSSGGGSSSNRSYGGSNGGSNYGGGSRSNSGGNSNNNPSSRSSGTKKSSVGRHRTTIRKPVQDHMYHQLPDGRYDDLINGGTYERIPGMGGVSVSPNSGSTGTGDIGLNASKVEAIKKALDNYINAVNKTINIGLSTKMIQNAIKGPEAQVEVKKYISNADKACENFLNTLKKYGDTLENIKQRYVSSDKFNV